jgi:uncharacterized protein YjbI with pentapeptide repeats
LSRDELQKDYWAGRRNFTDLNLAGLDLMGINLADADLSGCNLNGSILVAARLQGANLSGVNLENADLKMANLQRTNLSRANLQGVNMTYLNLGEVNLEEANLERAILLDIRLGGANLTLANLRNTDLRRAFLFRTILQSADLTGADLTGANLQESDLTGADLTNARVDGVSWLGCVLDNPSVLPAKEALIWQIHNTESCNLAGTDFSKADLRQTNLQGLDLSGKNFSKANLLNANLTGSNLAGADLSGAMLAKANFTNANLADANLTNVHLGGTNFSGANLQGIQFEGSSFFYANCGDALNIPSSILSTSMMPADHPDTEFVDSIINATEGLHCNSEKDDPYDVFLWDVEKKGTFTLEKLLRSTAYLKSISSLSALQQINLPTELLARAYQVLLDSVQELIKDVQIYQFTTESLRDVSHVMPCIIIGRTECADWFGISTKVSLGMQVKTQEKFYTDDGAVAKPENQRLISIFEEVLSEVNEMLPDSEATDELVWDLASSRESMLQNLLLKTKHFAIKDTEGCEYLFQEDIPDEEDRRKAFSQIVLDNLLDIRVYFIGSSNVDLFLLGKTRNHEWIGIRTGVTWT